MKIGDTVRNKKSGITGTVLFSTSGISIHYWDEDAKLLIQIVGNDPASYEEDS